MIKVASNSVLDLNKLTVGTGSVTVNDKSITLTSTSSTDKAYVHKFIPTRAGTRVTARITARCLIAPEVGKEMKLAFDNYKQGLVSQIAIDSTDWKTYTISTTVPYDKSGIVYFKAVAGAWNNQISSVEIAEFDVFVEDTGFASARIHAMGVINVNTATLDTQRTAIGIRDLMYQDGVLTIQTDNFINMIVGDNLPAQHLQLQANVKCPVQAYISAFDHKTGVIKVKFASLQTGENVDIRTAPFTDGGNVFKLHFSSLF